MKALYKLIALFLMGLVRHAQSSLVNFQFLCGILTKKSGMKFTENFRDFTELAGSNIALSIYHASSVFPQYSSSLNMESIRSLFLT